MERRQLSVSDCELSVVIPAFNGMGFIKEQLDSLANQATTLRWEVIVADNGSTDQTRDYVTSRALEFPVPLRVVDASARRGVSHARNAGAIAARSDHVAICDCDDAVDRHWIDEIYKALQTADVVGGALSTLHVNDPVFTSSELALPRVVHTRVGPVQELNGCNMGLRREALLKVGGFDESYDRGADDIDMGWRASLAGLRVSVAPRAIVYYRRRPKAIEEWRQRSRGGRAYVLQRLRNSELLIARPSWLRTFGGVAVATMQIPRRVFSRLGRRHIVSDFAWRWGEIGGLREFRPGRPLPERILMTTPGWHP